MKMHFFIVDNWRCMSSKVAARALLPRPVPRDTFARQGRGVARQINILSILLLIKVISEKLKVSKKR